MYYNIIIQYIIYNIHITYFSFYLHSKKLLTFLKKSLSRLGVFPTLYQPFVFTPRNDRHFLFFFIYRDKFELSSRRAYVYSRYAWQLLAASPPGPGRQLHRRPTFGEFAAYLIREHVADYDNHWLPYWLHCHMCALEYDVIAKMETMEDDMNFITGSRQLSALIHCFKFYYYLCALI